MARRRGRPKRGDPNHHLSVVEGIWHFRWCRAGRDVRISTGCPKSEVAAARRIRDQHIARFSAERFGVEEIPRAKSLDDVIKAYLAAESRTYDRDRGGEQPGCKRSAAGDRSVVDQLRRHFEFALPVDRVDKERLLDAAGAMAAEGLAPNTIRNRFRFVCRVFNWARANRRKTGLVVNVFADLDRGERKRLFGGSVARKAPPYTREQLRALYDRLQAHAYRAVRFAAHSGVRMGELLRMTWERVDLDGRTYTTDARWTKGGRERVVPLGDVALGILTQIRPADPKPGDAVWLNSKDEPLRDLDSVLKRAVLKVIPEEPGPGARRPDRHSLRRTCASAVAQVAPMAVVAAILGHRGQTVTDIYVSIPLAEQIAALNRAALLIDGEPQANVVPLVAKTARKTATARADGGRVGATH